MTMTATNAVAMNGVAGVRPLLLAPRFDQFPAALTAIRRWVVWEGVYQPDKGKYSKVPYNASRPSQKASSTDPSTWSDFKTARRAYERSNKRFSGVGIVLSDEDLLCGVDLDHVITGDKTLTGDAARIVDALDTYCEVSPSGTGVRLFLYAELPPGGRKKGDIEVYGNARFLTVTGRRCNGVPATIESRQAEIEAFHRNVFPPTPKVDRIQAKGNGLADASDSGLLAKATSSTNGFKIAALYSGDTSGYPGHSEADMALCALLAFWTGDDPARLDRLFRASGLMRDKWDEVHYADGSTYGEHTIQTVLANWRKFYDPEFRQQTAQNINESVKSPTDKNDKNPHERIIPAFEGVEPLSLVTQLLPVELLTPAILPPGIRAWCVDVAERGSFPLEYVATSALVALSSVVGRRIGIRPKRYDDWTVVPNLWGLVVGPPGVFKTPALTEALKPLQRLEVAARTAHQKAMVEYEAALEIAKLQVVVAKDKLKTAVKSGKTGQDLIDLARASTYKDETAVPTCTRYIVNDATIEKLGELLSENPFGLLNYRDEMMGFMRSLEKQGHENDRSFWLEAWNGTATSYTYDRIGRGSIVIESVCLSLLGGIQPGPLSRYLRTAAEGQEADGFVSRFQLMVYPDPPHRFVNVDRWPNTVAKNEAFDVFERLANLTPANVGGILDEGKLSTNEIPYLHFAPDAQEVFDDWRCDLENRLRSGQESPSLTLHLSKYRSLMPSLALLLHLIEAASNDFTPIAGPVSLIAIQNAIRWCSLLESHARRIYQSALDASPQAAQSLAERIKQSLPNPFTPRDIVRKGWSGLTTHAEVEQAIGFLSDRGWVKSSIWQPTDENGIPRGRPSEEVWINPLLLKVTEPIEEGEV